MEFLEKILKFLEENQVLLTALGLGGAGTIIFWLKGIPQSIYDIFKREFTTELQVSNQNRIFYDILKLVEKMYKDKNLRKLKLVNGMWGYDKETTISMGYGTHLLKYNNTFLIVKLVKEAANQTNKEKDSLIFLKFGRDHKVFDSIVKDAEFMDSDQSINRVYKMDDDSWSYVKDQKKRPLESIFIENDKKYLIIRTLSDFLAKENWYLSHGIPYQLGILLYGPPGTGKTSLIKAIAAHLDYHIYYLPVSSLHKIESASADLPDKCLMVIEDIDSNFVTMKRDDEDEPVKKKGKVARKNTGEETFFGAMGQMALSELLNSLDGLFSSHGRILIATTNHLENLDPAIIRPGRFDIKLEVGYVNNEILKIFFDSFYPNNNINFDSLYLKPELTVAKLQNLILCGYDQDYILEYCKRGE